MEYSMEYLRDWIRNIVVYMILNTIIMNLLGDKSYKKYVSIVSGMILLLIVITPVLRITKLEDSLNFFLQANDYTVEASEFKNDVNRMEKEQRELIFAEYEKKLQSQVEALLLEEGFILTDFQVTIEMNTESYHFGELLSINIEAKPKQEGDEDKKSHLSIDRIEIERIDRIKKKEDVQKPPTPMEIQIKNRLAEFYNMEQVNINITIQE
jgi:stage III sporulation protein AF